MQILTQKKGFTLVETLVAITILLLAITGTVSTAQKGMQNAYYASDQVTAVFLAQEALESVRKYRDAKALLAYNSPVGTVDTADWLPTTLCGTSGCIFDTSVSVPFVPCPTTSSCDVVYLDSSDVYNQTPSGTATKFHRRVYINDSLAATTGGVEVTVDVTWDAQVFNNATRHVNLTTWLYDHYQRYEN